MSAASAAPASPDPYANYRELTLRGMVLGALITSCSRPPTSTWV